MATNDVQPNETKEASTEDVVAEVSTKKDFSSSVAQHHTVLRKPHITERSYQLQELGKYVFTVSPRATKKDVKKAVEDVYDVTVTGVNIITKKPKVKVFRGTTGMRSGVKRAIVTLKKGQEIKLIETA